MSLPGVAAKYAPIVLPLAAGGAAMHDPLTIQIGAILIGLIFGAMWRAGSLTSEGKAWSVIRRDLLISALIGGANAVLALAAAQVLGFGPLLTMGLGVLVGATGLRAVPEAKAALLDALRRKLLGIDVALVHPRDDDARDLVRRLDEREKR